MATPGGPLTPGTQGPSPTGQTPPPTPSPAQGPAVTAPIKLPGGQTVSAPQLSDSRIAEIKAELLAPQTTPTIKTSLDDNSFTALTKESPEVATPYRLGATLIVDFVESEVGERWELNQQLMALATPGFELVEGPTGWPTEVNFNGNISPTGAFLGKGAIKTVREVGSEEAIGRIKLQEPKLLETLRGLVSEFKISKEVTQKSPDVQMVAYKGLAIVEGSVGGQNAYLLMDKAEQDFNAFLLGSHSLPSIPQSASLSDPKKVIDSLLTAIRGLKACHEAGYLHMDFRDLNILTGDKGGLSDFGQAIAIDQFQTDPSSVTQLTSSCCCPITWRLATVLNKDVAPSNKEKFLKLLDEHKFEEAKELLRPEGQLMVPHAKEHLKDFQYIREHPTSSEVYSLGLVLYFSEMGYYPNYIAEENRPDLLNSCPPKKLLQDVKPSHPAYADSFHNFVCKCLSFDPKTRPTLDEAIKFLEEYQTKKNKPSVVSPPAYMMCEDAWGVEDPLTTDELLDALEDEGVLKGHKLNFDVPNTPGLTEQEKKDLQDSLFGVANVAIRHLDTLYCVNTLIADEHKQSGQVLVDDQKKIEEAKEVRDRLQEQYKLYFIEINNIPTLPGGNP